MPGKSDEGWRRWSRTVAGSGFQGTDSVMARTETFTCFIISCDSTDGAYQAYQAVKDRFYETGALEAFDAAVVDRQDTGRFGICKTPQRPDGDGLPAKRQWGLAPGLVVTLSPGAAAGSGLDTANPRALAELEIIAAYVSGGMIREGLQDLGSALDMEEAALAVVAAAGRSEGLDSLLAKYGRVAFGTARFDVDGLERDVREVERQEPNEVMK